MFKKMTLAGLACMVGAVLIAGAASAQSLSVRPMPSLPYINDSGYKITKYIARASADGCTGEQHYESVKDPGDKGISRRVWANATRVDGGVRCSNGQWFRGSGAVGGSEADLFIKAGRYYRIGG